MTGLQAKTPVDLSGITITEKTISENDRKVNLYIVKPEKVQGTPPVILFIHGGVWLAGNFENHKRLVRDLVVGTGAAVGFLNTTDPGRDLSDADRRELRSVEVGGGTWRGDRCGW